MPSVAGKSNVTGGSSVSSWSSGSSSGFSSGSSSGSESEDEIGELIHDEDKMNRAIRRLHSRRRKHVASAALRATARESSALRAAVTGTMAPKQGGQPAWKYRGRWWGVERLPSRHVEATLKFKGRGNKVKASWSPSKVASQASLARMSLILKKTKQPRRPASAAPERPGQKRSDDGGTRARRGRGGRRLTTGSRARGGMQACREQGRRPRARGDTIVYPDASCMVVSTEKAAVGAAHVPPPAPF